FYRKTVLVLAVMVHMLKFAPMGSAPPWCGPDGGPPAGHGRCPSDTPWRGDSPTPAWAAARGAAPAVAALRPPRAGPREAGWTARRAARRAARGGSWRPLGPPAGRAGPGRWAW